MSLELIGTDSYAECCDLVFDENSTEIPKNGSTVLCKSHNIMKLFSLVEDTNNKYVIVSPNCDIGFTLQHKEPVANDTYKALQHIQLKNDYEPVFVTAKCDNNTCKLTDKYSYRSTSFTYGTFNKIPTNIKKWFSVNNNIDDDDRIVNIPLGLPPWSKRIIESYSANTKERPILLYINASINTLDRLMIMQAYQENIKRRDVIVINGNQNRTHQEFCQDVSQSYATLCLEGNGYDTFRVLESLYLGSFPAFFKKNKWQQAYQGLPLLHLNEELLNDSIINRRVQHNFNLENTKADMNFWRKEIQESRKLIV